MRPDFIFWIVFLVSSYLVSGQDVDFHDSDRKSKQEVGIFSVIRFPNDACQGSNDKNGTCYTKEECRERGGSNVGSCANGYGVCCTFSGSCGSSMSENCTYFEDNASTGGACNFQVCKCRENICQLRLDLIMFTVTGPSTDTTVVTNILNGNPSDSGGGVDATVSSQCLTDVFSVTSPGGQAPPTICGENSGEHMYVDASDACNNLVFQFGETPMGAPVVNRRWSIKVTQYTCDFPNLAPSGCTQYLFGSSSGTVQTFNYDGGHHLAGQNQNICVRREGKMCKICWTTQANEDFAVSGDQAVMKQYSQGTQCCGYGEDGKGTKGFDCVVIPGARKGAAPTVQLGSLQCGRGAGLVTTKTSGTLAGTICSTRLPFSIRFLSDMYEWATEVTALGPTNVGFRLTYFQDGTDC